MNGLVTRDFVASVDGLMHLVELPGEFGDIESMLNTQIELDGKRVFVRMIDINIGPASEQDKTLVGLIVSSIY